MKELLLDKVTSQYLDNADLRIQVSENFNWVKLTFIAFGKVEDNYWKVNFFCDGIISLDILKDINEDGGYEDCFLVLNTKVLSKSNNDLDAIKRSNCRNIDSFWSIEIYGSCSIEINCINFSWDIINLNEEEYNEFRK